MKLSILEKRELDKFTKFLALKCTQIIVQSRLGEKVSTNCRPQTTGTDWFNLNISDLPDVLAETKRVLNGEILSSKLPLCVEISLRTSEGDRMVLENWCLSMLPEQCDPTTRIVHTIYNRMGTLLKTLVSITRAVPAYKLSRRQGPDSFVICYRVFLAEPLIQCLGDDFNQVQIGQICTPIGTLSLSVAYRTKMTISPTQAQTQTQKQTQEELEESDVNSDYSYHHSTSESASSEDEEQYYARLKRKVERRNDRFPFATTREFRASDFPDYKTRKAEKDIWKSIGVYKRKKRHAKIEKDKTTEVENKMTDIETSTTEVETKNIGDKNDDNGQQEANGNSVTELAAKLNNLSVDPPDPFDYTEWEPPFCSGNSFMIQWGRFYHMVKNPPSINPRVPTAEELQSTLDYWESRAPEFDAILEKFSQSDSK
ncbi:autophagy-related protein 13 [Diorhabda sublineata]|uniref:autophagy-related protein 13 n=1 Tax=Diorhabda sublineata TaxID=1163346 RepID=UPI0024E10217|nr:autophagy-related protein 13 [Diorhabda sublineata]